MSERLRRWACEHLLKDEIQELASACFSDYADSANVVIQGPRGCGKTTEALCLARSLASNGNKVMFICMEHSDACLNLDVVSHQPTWESLQGLHYDYIFYDRVYNRTLIRELRKHCRRLVVVWNWPWTGWVQ